MKEDSKDDDVTDFVLDLVGSIKHTASLPEVVKFALKSSSKKGSIPG